MAQRQYKLPYLNTCKLVFLTVAINMLCAFFFQRSLVLMSEQQIIIDGAVSGGLTALINTVVIYNIMRHRQAEGIVPGNIPVNKIMQLLPAYLGGLVGINVVLFTLVGFATEIVFLRFFGIETLSVRNWLFLKVAYICILSAKIIEFIVLRMVQPDWQRKVDKTKPSPGSTFIGEVKNPLPTISSVKEVYGAVAANIAMNIIMGYVMGDVYIQPDKALVVKPTNPIGLGITGVILGGLTAFLVTKSVLKALPAADNGKNTKQWTLIVVLCLFSMAGSAFIMPLVMSIMELREMNFLQFCIFITAYSSLLSKFLTALLVARWKYKYQKKVL
ncbi:MAG: hypothetical protein LKE29_08265 [Acidaminococcaceae bacterium]|jgi:hypothetical protein|nr:hypothetical protein [Acidaminococcaceae bacterium]